MSDQIDNPARAGEVAQQIVSILINEPSATRRRAVQAAMLLLGETPLVHSTATNSLSVAEDGEVDLGSFFERDEKLKPSDAAQLCAAYHYSLYGMATFTLDEIRTIASDAGVVLPNRLDMTFGHATKNGKKLFQSVGRGSYKPTAAGGLSFKERWGLKPGRKTKTPASS